MTKRDHQHSRVARWAAVKTVAGLLDCSVTSVRRAVRRRHWRMRRLHGRNGQLRIALGADGFPVRP